MKAVRDTTEKLRRDHIILLERYSSLEKENERIKAELIEFKNNSGNLITNSNSNINDTKEKDQEILEAAQKEIQIGIEEKLERDKIIKSLKNANKTLETHLTQNQNQILKLKSYLKSSEEDAASMIKVISDMKLHINGLEHEIQDLNTELKEKEMVIPKTIEINHIAIQVQIEHDECKDDNNTSFKGKRGLLIEDDGNNDKDSDDCRKILKDIGCQTGKEKGREERKVSSVPNPITRKNVSVHAPMLLAVPDAVIPPTPPATSTITTTSTTTPIKTKKEIDKDEDKDDSEVNFAAFIKLKKENRELKLHIAQMANK